MVVLAARSALFAILLPAIHAEVIDRVAIAVGRHVITESDIDTEVRVTAFLEGSGEAKPNPDARKQAASRLIQQTLIRREIELTRFPTPKSADAEPLMDQARTLHGDSFAKDLTTAGLRQQDLADHLLWQLTLLRFVQYRFQPGIQITDEEAKYYYDSQLPRWASEGKTAPPMDSIRKQIDSILTQQRVDQALDRWLAEQRSQTTIVYRIKGLEE